MNFSRKPQKSKARKASNFPLRLRQLWLDQLTFLAKRKLTPSKPSQVDAFLSYLVENYKKPVVSLWQSYNVPGSKSQFLRVTEAQHAISYLMAFHPNNLQRNLEILKRSDEGSPWIKSLGQQKKVHIMDLGCGAAAWSASLLEQINSGPQSAEIYVDLVDRSKYLLQAAQIGLEKNYKIKSLKTLQADLRDKKASDIFLKILRLCETDNRVLVIGLSYVWNELNSTKSKDQLLGLLQKALKSKVPVVLHFSEPGREKEAREAQMVREWLSSEGMHLLYPCPSSASCPMLQQQKDWCYSEVHNHDLHEWNWISDVLKLKRQRLSTASYICLNPSAIDALRPAAPPKARFVGFPEISGKKQSLLCDRAQLKKSPIFSPYFLRGQEFSPKSRSQTQK